MTLGRPVPTVSSKRNPALTMKGQDMKAPTPLPRADVKVIKGVTKQQCIACDKWLPLTREHWYVFKPATLNTWYSRCKKCVIAHAPVGDRRKAAKATAKA